MINRVIHSGVNTSTEVKKKQFVLQLCIRTILPLDMYVQYRMSSCQSLALPFEHFYFCFPVFLLSALYASPGGLGAWL